MIKCSPLLFRRRSLAPMHSCCQCVLCVKLHQLPPTVRNRRFQELTSLRVVARMKSCMARDTRATRSGVSMTRHQAAIQNQRQSITCFKNLTASLESKALPLPPDKLLSRRDSS
jgi:hypothetical protein